MADEIVLFTGMSVVDVGTFRFIFWLKSVQSRFWRSLA